MQSPAGFTNSMRKIECSSAFLVAIVVAAVVGAVAGDAHATTVINRNVPEMTRVSGLVLSGVVADVVPNQSAPGFPLATRVTVAVDRVFKGFMSGPTIRFMIPGGTRDGKVLVIPGMPAFTPGEEVVLFLERTPRGWIPSGLKNGKYVVSGDDAGRRVVWRDSDGLTRIATDRSVTPRAAAEYDLLTFDELVGLIEEGLETPDDAPVPAPAAEGGAR